MEDVTTLALAARNGDPTALSSFVRNTWNDVARLVTAVAGRDLAEDATQDAYLRAIRALPSYRGEASGRTWLLAIARRAAVDAVRGAARRRRVTARLVARNDMPTSVGIDDMTLTEQLLTRLEPDRRSAFALTQLLDLSYAEAAAVCGCPVGTIRSRVARARDDLIRHLGTDRLPGLTAPPTPPAPPPDAPPLRITAR